MDTVYRVGHMGLTRKGRPVGCCSLASSTCRRGVSAGGIRYCVIPRSKRIAAMGFMDVSWRSAAIELGCSLWRALSQGGVNHDTGRSYKALRGARRYTQDHEKRSLNQRPLLRQMGRRPDRFVTSWSGCRGRSRHAISRTCTVGVCTCRWCWAKLASGWASSQRYPGRLVAGHESMVRASHGCIMVGEERADAAAGSIEEKCEHECRYSFGSCPLCAANGG